MLLVGRTFDVNYRYGFNGAENDDEYSGNGNSLEFGGRSIYDSRLGRFVSIDPRFGEFPFFSAYCYAANNPILYIDSYGEGPAIPPVDIAKIKTIVRFHSRWIYLTMEAALTTNFNWDMLKKYTQNEKTNVNVIKGIIGEAIVAAKLDDLTDDQGFDEVNGTVEVGENKRTDVSLSINTEPSGAGFLIDDDYQNPSIFNLPSNNVDGSEIDGGTSYSFLDYSLYEGEFKFIIEVKTWNPYAVNPEFVAKGIDQVISNTLAHKVSNNGKFDHFIPVFVIDKQAWEAAYREDSAKITAAYQKLTANGGQLLLVDQLNTKATNKMHKLKKKINSSASDTTSEDSLVDGGD